MQPTTCAQHFQLHRNILNDLGYQLNPGATVLDFGCGRGEMVAEYRQSGYQAYGCDLQIANETEFVRGIDPQSHRLPFEDNLFDFVFSDQVLEHVQRQDQAFSEIKRVMKPGAISLHIFPAKLRPTEAHVFVPFGGLIQNRAWLLLWSFLGIRNSFQVRKGFREVADLNHRFLKNKTNYLWKSEIVATVSAYFESFLFAENYMIKNSYGRARHLYPLVRVAPFVTALYATFYCRVLFAQKSLPGKATS